MGSQVGTIRSVIEAQYSALCQIPTMLLEFEVGSNKTPPFSKGMLSFLLKLEVKSLQNRIEKSPPGRAETTKTELALVWENIAIKPTNNKILVDCRSVRINPSLIKTRAFCWKIF